jgi:hypothetical protein
MIDESHDEIRRSVGLLPLYGLADWSGLRRLGSWGWSDGALSAAGLAYGERAAAGPWAQIVTTAGSAEDEVTNQRTAMRFAAQPVRDGETFELVLDAVTAEQPGEVTIEVDGAGKAFRYWREQSTGHGDCPDWYAALAEVPGLVVTGCGLEPHDVRLVTVTDVEPYLAATKEHLIAHYDAATPSSDQP